jgi:integrase
MDDTKTKDSDNTVPLPKITRRVLIEHRDRQAAERAYAGEPWTEQSRVFLTSVGIPMEPRNLNRHFHAIRPRAGYPQVRLQDVHHTVVSLPVQLTTPPHVVQRIARHADLDVTLGIYAHTDLDVMRETLDSIEWDDR